MAIKTKFTSQDTNETKVGVRQSRYPEWTFVDGVKVLVGCVGSDSDRTSTYRNFAFRKISYYDDPKGSGAVGSKPYEVHTCKLTRPLKRRRFSDSASASEPCTQAAPNGARYYTNVIEYSSPGFGLDCLSPWTAVPLSSTGPSYIGLPTKDFNDLVFNLYSKIVNEKVNIGQELGTLLQTADTFANLVFSVSDVIHLAKRGKVREMISSLKRTVNRYRFHEVNNRESRFGRILEEAKYYNLFVNDLAQYHLSVYYALQPVFITAGNLLDYLNNDRMRPITFSASSKVTLAPPREIFYNSNVSGTYQAIMKCYLRMDNPIDSYQKEFGLDLRNLLYVAWDLTPWSFVVDWVSRASDYITMYRAKQGLTYIDGFYNIKLDLNITTDVKDEGLVEVIDQAKYEYAAFNRRVQKTWPSPSLTLRNPFYNRWNYLNLAALIKTNLK